MQTAYANGASGEYLRNACGLALDFAKTGVKFVHHVASHYGVGVYFEANGHGTVLLRPSTVAAVRARGAALPHTAASHVGAAGAASTARAAVACQRLLAVAQLVNQAV